LRHRIASRRLLPAFCAVVPADVGDDGKLELRARPPGAVGDQLDLEAVDERLGERVVVGIPERSDRGDMEFRRAE
jgi:hypothetical protein